MTEQNLDWQYRQPSTPPKKKGWRLRHLAAAYAAGGLLLGLGLGAATATHETVTRDVPGPERIVNHDVEVKVPVTPPECIKALELYDQVVSLSGEAMGYMNDAMKAASRLDAAGITASSEKLGPVTEKTKALTDPLIAARTTCKASG